MLIVKITMVGVFQSAHSFGSKITRLAHFRFRTLNYADVLLDSGLKLSNNVMYKNVHYVRMVHCMIKPRPDLESTYQAGRFDI